MKKSFFSLRGVTLLETMLVLAIGTSFFLAIFQNYQGYKARQGAELVQRQVGMLFQAAGLFYRDNCGAKYSATSGEITKPVTFGRLHPDPTTGAIPTTPQAIDILNDLVTPGYLSQVLIPNVLVSQYVVQFNPINLNRDTYLALGFDTTQNTYTLPIIDQDRSMKSTNATNIPKVLLWQIQVSAKLRDTASVFRQARILNGTCTAGDGATGLVQTCDAASEEKLIAAQTAASTGATYTSTDSYVVWTKLPSATDPELISTMSKSLLSRKIFNLQYTNDMMYELNNRNEPTSVQKTQFYLCGG